jgi:branched-chain amino acid transport system substrate-binding protein
MLVEGVEATEGDASADALIPVYEGDFTFDGPKGEVIIRSYDHVALQSLYFAALDNVTDPDLDFVELIKEFSPEESAPPCQLPEAYADRCPEVEEVVEEVEYPFAGQDVVIGLMTDKSGALAIYGPSQTQGFYLGLEYATNGTMEVAGRPIVVIEKDNGSDPETGVAQARELIEAEGAEILLGNISSGVALAVMPVVEENDVIFIAEPAAAPQITADNFSPNTFRTSRTSFQDALVMGTGLLDMGETFVQIAPDYAFGYGSACSFYPVVKEGGGEFLINDTPEGCGTIFAPLDTTDFTPYINQILETEADVLIVTWAGAGFAPMFQQMGQLGVFDEMVIGTGIGDNQTLAAGYADALGSVGVHVYHYTYPDNEINDWLVERHIEEYGAPPDLWAAGGMMAAIMVVDGLEATLGDTSADALIPVYEGDFTFDGPKGEVIIRPYDHVALQSLYFAALDNVTDPDLDFVELIKEFSPEESAPPCQLPEAYANRCP